MQATKTLISSSTKIEPTGSTIGIDIHDVSKLNIINKVDITIWDFAGQMEYATNHQVRLLVDLLIHKYFLSSWNVIYILVVDISQPLEEQKQKTYFWLQYMRSQLKEGGNYTIIIVGNKIDLVNSDADIKMSKEFFRKLRESSDIADYFTMAASSSLNIKKVLQFIKKVCVRFLDKKDSFAVPQIYKRVADRIKELKVNGILLTGFARVSIL